jgi:magnesium-transporting ATPase (P-type)
MCSSLMLTGNDWPPHASNVSGPACLKSRLPCSLQGAPERVLARCTHLVSNAGGAPAPLSDAGRRRVLQQVEQLGASRALRCLALAAKTVAAQHRQVS